MWSWVTSRLSLAYAYQLGSYPTPHNISYAWSFGSLSGITMAWQAITGLGLVAVYVPATEQATESLEAINRDAVGGWLIRATHANTPSLLFLWLYIHQARSLLIGTRLVWAWASGWLVIMLTIIVAFLGYSLVWAQMSYWAATVITSLVTVVPLGDQILGGLWGGPLIAQPTLSRFMAWHFLLGIAVLAVVVAHMIAVHYTGSSNPLGTGAIDKVPFMRYFVVKDAVALAVGSCLASLLILGAPTLAMDTELYLAINTMSTPSHIVPEWYLLPYYAVLRCIPNKAMGCVAAIGVIGLMLMACVRASAPSV